MEKENLKLDKLKVLKMIFFHEFGEIDNGDITPFDNVSIEEKHCKERKCVERISEECKMPEILTLWLEFEENKTDEAKFVRIVDKFDAVLQAQVYSDKIQDGGKLFEEFYLHYQDLIKGFEKYLGEQND